MRKILHCDLNNFFASVECLRNPKLKNVPMAVCGDPNTRHGIILAKNELAKKYASEYGANQEIVSLAALLHDVASVTDVTYTEEHHIIGAKIAEELLLQENYPIEKIEQIKKCILNHRGSRLASKNSPEEICIADSDAMAHFYSIPSLLSMVYREKNLSIDEGSKFVMEKLERSYNKMSTKGKKLVKKQYESAKNILK